MKNYIKNNLGNAGLVILPTNKKFSSTMSFSFIHDQQAHYTSGGSSNKHQANESMIHLSLDERQCTLLDIYNHESQIIDKFNEKYDLAVSVSRLSRKQDLKTQRNRKINMAISKLLAKRDQLEELSKKTLSMDAFLLTKEQFNAIPDNLLIRKMHINIDDEFENKYNFDDTFLTGKIV